MSRRTRYQEGEQPVTATYSDLGYGPLTDIRATLYRWDITCDGDILYRVLARNHEYLSQDSYTEGPWFTVVGESAIAEGHGYVSVAPVADEFLLQIASDGASNATVSGRAVIVQLDSPGALYSYTGSFTEP
jgi:hypothetical protein